MLIVVFATTMLDQIADSSAARVLTTAALAIYIIAEWRKTSHLGRFMLVTTLIVVVMKVYDIVKVMTNGEFQTNVIANEMFDQAFRFTQAGRGSALATVLFLFIVPIMYVNIRRVRKEGAMR